MGYSKHKTIRPRFVRVVMAWAIATLLSGCGAFEAVQNRDIVPVSVSGINYSDKPLSAYIFYDPANEDKTYAGEPLGAYEAGGILCCYPLPKQWRPGIKVGLLVDDDTPEEKRTYTIIEIPPYPDGKVGMLWAVIYPDGKVAAVSSAFDPPSDKWPAKIKGWPVPSLDFRRKLWRRDMDLLQSTVNSSEQGISDPSYSEEERDRAKRVNESAKSRLKILESKKP